MPTCIGILSPAYTGHAQTRALSRRVRAGGILREAAGDGLERAWLEGTALGVAETGNNVGLILLLLLLLLLFGGGAFYLTENLLVLIVLVLIILAVAGYGVRGRRG